MDALILLFKLVLSIVGSVLLIAFLLSPIIIIIILLKHVFTKNTDNKSNYQRNYYNNPYNYQNINNNSNSNNYSNTNSNVSYNNNQSINNNNKHVTIYPYEKRKILTNTEYNFYVTLKEECDERNLIICPKVRMEDFLNVTTKKDHLKYRGYIKSRHIDFIICDKYINMICAIELDDPSHNNANAKRTDEFKNNVFKTISVPLLRVDVKSGRYREQIINILNYYCPLQTNK